MIQRWLDSFFRGDWGNTSAASYKVFRCCCPLTEPFAMECSLYIHTDGSVASERLRLVHFAVGRLAVLGDEAAFCSRTSFLCCLILSGNFRFDIYDAEHSQHGIR